MRKRIFVPVIVAVLVLSTIGLAALSVQAITTLKESNTQLAGLKETITALKNDMASMRTITSGISAGQVASVAELVTLVNPAVVRIDVAGAGFKGVGSGFIVDVSGFVLTNQHVIADATSISVTLASGDSYTATVTDSDANRDLALIKMMSTRMDFPVIELGSASDAHVGDTVLIGGFPLGLELAGPATFTQGIVSAIRTIDGLTYIQTDASINPGNSGGPVIDMHGFLLGLCVAAVTDPNITVAGLGLAIPVGDVLAFIDSGRVECTSCHYTISEGSEVEQFTLCRRSHSYIA